MTGDERPQIEAAIDRLLAGMPLRSDGKLTIVSLAIEAGLKRHVLTPLGALPALRRQPQSCGLLIRTQILPS